MAHAYLTVERNQQYLLPPDMADWLPADHLAWFILDVVDQFDLSDFERCHRADGRGRAAYDPAMVVAVLLYAYCVGERSSRAIERRCREDVAFRVLAANHAPDHTTIARFLQANESAFDALFTQVLRLCREAGMARVGTLVIDGTKVAANLSADAIAAEVARIRAEAKATDAAEDARYGDAAGDELPAGLADPRSRLVRLVAAKERLDAEEAARQAAHEQRLADRAQQEAAEGRRIPGRKPRPPHTPAASKANVTDPDSRSMKAPARFIQGYNAQAVVTEDQLIVSAGITQDRCDNAQLLPLLAAARHELDSAGMIEPPSALVGDAGYWSLSNATADTGVGLFVVPQTDPRYRPPQLATTGRIPNHATPFQRMERKLATKRGRSLYGLRARSVEPVFGQIKEGRRISRFRRRGLGPVSSEWRLLATTHNLLKLWRRQSMAALA